MHLFAAPVPPRGVVAGYVLFSGTWRPCGAFAMPVPWGRCRRMHLFAAPVPPWGHGCGICAFLGAAGRLEALFAAPVPPRGVVAGYGLFSGAAGRLEAFLRRLFRGGDAEGCTFSGNRTTAEVLPLHPALRRRAERLPGFVTLLRTEGCLFRSGRKRAIVPEGAHRCEKEDDPPLWADRPSLVVAPGLPRFSGAFRAGAVFRRQRLFSFASMHSVAWGTFISRSLGMSFPVVLQMP